MAELFYRLDRDNDFYNACRTVIRNQKNLSVIEIVSRATRMPAKSFYLHAKEYSNIIRIDGKRLPKNKDKQALHIEIVKRYKLLKQSNPNLNKNEIIKMISNQKAPRFYISVARARDLYYELIKKPQSHFI